MTSLFNHGHSLVMTVTIFSLYLFCFCFFSLPFPWKGFLLSPLNTTVNIKLLIHWFILLSVDVLSRLFSASHWQKSWGVKSWVRHSHCPQGINNLVGVERQANRYIIKQHSYMLLLRYEPNAVGAQFSQECLLYHLYLYIWKRMHKSSLNDFKPQRTRWREIFWQRALSYCPWNNIKRLPTLSLCKARLANNSTSSNKLIIQHLAQEGVPPSVNWEKHMSAVKHLKQYRDWR